jgi:hypothetical protein
MRLQAVRMTPRARAWLSVSGAGEVLHVFEAAAYAVKANAEVLALTAESLGAGPLSLVVRSPAVPWSELMSPGAQVEVEEAELRVGRLSVSLAGATLWDSRPPWAELRPFRTRLAAGWDELRKMALRHCPPDSLAWLLDPQAGDRGPESVSGQLRLRAGDAASRLLAAVAKEILNDGVIPPKTGLAAAAQELAGLGTGFTPAGDDFLLGIMYALWSTCPPDQAGAMSVRLAEAAVPRTARVSAAWLRAGAAGEAGDSWHALVAALLEDDRPETEAAVARIARIGHTSGADALAGFLLALRKLLVG